MNEEPLAQRFGVYLFDLDGVLYAGSKPIPGAPEQLARLRETGAAIGYVTNNAARTPSEVAEKLSTLDIPATPSQVVTSAQAAAAMLAAEFPAGTRILVIGGAGLTQAVSERGLTPVYQADDGPEAVVQGFHPDLGWRALAEGAYAVAGGARWIATNTDRTLPTDHGFAPGNGALVETIVIATDRRPSIAGKPERPVFDEALARLGTVRSAELAVPARTICSAEPDAGDAGRTALVIGDRLDTDIAGARNAGLSSLLVLTGVTGLRDLVDAPRQHRPSYVACDLAGLFRPYRAPRPDGEGVRCGGWLAELDDRRIRVTGAGPPDEAVRALVGLAWRHADPKTLDFDLVADAGQ